MGLALLPLLLASQVQVPASETEYTVNEAGRWCLYATVTDVEGDESGPSNTVCKDTPTTFRWTPPTENEDGTPVDPLDFYTLFFNEPMQRPGPITMGTEILWAESPPYIYYLPETDFDGSQYIDAGNWSVPGQSLTITATITRRANMPTDARIISKATGTAEQDHDFMLSQYYGALRFRLKTNGITSTLIGSTDLPLDIPVNIRATYDGESMRLFINDVEDASMSKSGDMDQSSKTVRVGMNPGGYGGWDGTIQIEVR